jgi:hypothetical protein
MSLTLNDLRKVVHWHEFGLGRHEIQPVTVADLVEVLKEQGAHETIAYDTGMGRQVIIWVGEPGPYLVLKVDE